ncbi:MAG: hypothetical protein K2L15_03165 [Eubacteriales bacterium]|nr:hypothetical protein [Eubacteriales bacterium]
MNKFLKKISKFFVFVYLIIAFSVVIWALNDINGDKVISEWSERHTGESNKIAIGNKAFKDDGSTIEGTDKVKGSYNKVNESFTVSLETFGYIGTSDNGTPLDRFDEETGKEFYGFDIDGDGDKPEDFDYRLAIDIWKVSMPLNVRITVAPNLDSGIVDYDNATIVSPKIELVNYSELDAKVFVRQMRVLENKNNTINFVDNKSDIENSVGDAKNDDLYLGVTSADTINNGFGELGEESLSGVITKEGYYPSIDDMIELGTLDKFNGETTAGRFKFIGRAKKEFLSTHKNVSVSDDGFITRDPYEYKLSYIFKRVAPAQNPNSN